MTNDDATQRRERFFVIRVNDKERTTIGLLAKAERKSASDVVRSAIEDRATRLAGMERRAES